MAKPRTRAAPARATSAAWRVWELYTDHCFQNTGDHFDGYLVTEADDPQRPIAHVLPDLTDTSRTGPTVPADQRRAALRDALDLIEDPTPLDAAEGRCSVRDLRGYCRLDSPLPMPAGYYACRLSVLGAGSFDSIAFAPFCRFRLARMIDAHNRLAFDRATLEKMPDAFVAVCPDFADSGGYEARPVRFDLGEVPL